MTYLEMLRAQLPIDEGERARLYTDTQGKVTIGIGRNLTDCGISEDEQALMFENDMRRAVAIARNVVPSFDSLNDARQYVVCNMAFNLGLGLRAFSRTLAAIAAGDWVQASDEMLDSLWAREVGERAVRLARVMREGEMRGNSP